MFGSVKPCPCPKLLERKAKFAQLEQQGLAAAAAYPPAPGEPPAPLPDGYRMARDDELAGFDLSRDQLEFPRDPPPDGPPTTFRAIVLVSDKGGPPIMSFRGTDAGADWTKANIPQGLGIKNYHYTQTQLLAKSIANSPNGKAVVFTGHSLGGGLAAAAAQATGRPATTFNAAGVHPDTVASPMCAPIDAVQIRGEMLTTLQKLPGLPVTPDTSIYSLAPPLIGADVVLALSFFATPLTMAAALAYRAYKLHGMVSVLDGIRNERERIDEDIREAGCSGSW